MEANYCILANYSVCSFPYQSELPNTQVFFFFSVWVFFHEHSQFTGQQGKGQDIYLTPLYHFHPLHRRLDIGRAIAAGAHVCAWLAAELEPGTFSFRAQVANH